MATEDVYVVLLHALPEVAKVPIWNNQQQQQQKD